MFTNSTFGTGRSLTPGIAPEYDFARLTTGESSRETSREDVCVANIGPAQRRRRLRFGLQAFAVGVGLAVLLVLVHANPLFRLGLFVPFVLGATGYFQAREKT